MNDQSPFVTFTRHPDRLRLRIRTGTVVGYIEFQDNVPTEKPVTQLLTIGIDGRVTEDLFLVVFETPEEVQEIVG